MAEGKKGGVVCEEVAEFEKRCLSIWPSLSLLRLANVARARNRQRWPWRGRGGAATLPPMGLSFADIQNLSRDPTQLYPVRIYLVCGGDVLCC